MLSRWFLRRLLNLKEEAAKAARCLNIFKPVSGVSSRLHETTVPCFFLILDHFVLDISGKAPLQLPLLMWRLQRPETAESCRLQVSLVHSFKAWGCKACRTWLITSPDVTRFRNISKLTGPRFEVKSASAVSGLTAIAGLCGDLELVTAGAHSTQNLGCWSCLSCIVITSLLHVTCKQPVGVRIFPPACSPFPRPRHGGWRRSSFRFLFG